MPSPAGRTNWFASTLGLVLLFGIWEIYVRAASVRPLVLPPPSRVVAHLTAEFGFYIPHAITTISEAALGFILAFVVAMLLAVGMVHSRLFEQATWPVVVLVQSTPVAALAPVFLIWFGINATPKILIAALFTFVPFVSNAFTGLRSIDRDTLEVFRSVDASTSEVFWRLRLPHALPSLFAAARICVGLSLVGAVVGELYGGARSGLGLLVKTGQQRQFVDQIWGSIFLLALIGIIGTLVVIWLERRLLSWHESQDR